MVTTHASIHNCHTHIPLSFLSSASFCLAMADCLALVKYWYIWYTKEVTESLSGMVVVTIMLGVRGHAMPSDRASVKACM